MDQTALSVINGLSGIESDWEGDTRDGAAVRAKDHSSTLSEQARRWNNASTVLDTAAEQLGLLRDEILKIVDDPENQRLFAISEVGGLAVNIRTDVDAYDESILERRATLESTLRTLLFSADAAAQMYDWQVANRLMGVTDEERPFIPELPPPRELPTVGKESARALANEDGSGDAQWDTWDPNLAEQVQLQAVRAFWLKGGMWGSTKGMENFYRLLRHFNQNTGEQMNVSVDALFNDLDGFQEKASTVAKETLASAQNVMPKGYTGPVAFQGNYSGSFTPEWTTNPDWFFTLGTFAFQESGVAIPTSQGNYNLATQTTIYDYYNFDQRGKLGMLNDLNRAGWAKTFDTTGTSSVQWGTS
ncbi:hypothetical protein [Mycolicibacterium fallax]|uniref:hypothetical protein n=1 Tax=Mycolicibacterium fallax TaxID=1793 RepID=UPI0010551579|nr:hypothetical protein [Mycolicibacterium fallax]